MSVFFMFYLAIGNAQKLEYTFQRKDSTTLLVTVLFNGGKNGKTTLHLPNEWAGQRQLYKSISKLSALSTKTIIDTTGKPDEYNIQYQPGSVVRFSYNLSKDWTGALRYPLYFRPVIMTGFFFFEGTTGLVYPDMAESAQVDCKISYKGFEKDCFYGNSFFANERSHKFKAPFGDVLNSFFCAGNFRAKTIDNGGHKIVMAVTGEFLFTDDEAFSAIGKIVLTERNFWNDSSPYFFITLLPLTDLGTTGGTAHQNSFYIAQSTILKITEGFIPVLSHEYFHTWIGQGLRMPTPDELYKWFSEGFTDYYSLKLLKLSGSITNDDFITRLNKNIKEYYLSPYFKTDNQELVGNYWKNPTLKTLSYRRGLTIAFMLDGEITGKVRYSLDDLMRKLYEQSKPQLIFSKPLLDSLILDYSDAGVLAAIDNAGHGKNDEMTKYLLANKAYQVQNVTISQIFDMGFNFEASKQAKKIIGLKPGSNAEKAGLTENMPITNEFSIWTNNTEKPMKVKVVRDGKPEWVTYIPVAETDIRIPQVILETK